MEEQELRNNNAGDLTEIVAALEKEYGALRGQIEQLEEDMFSVRQAMRPTLKEEVGALRGQIEQLEGRLSVREAKRPTLKEEVSALRGKIEQLEGRLSVRDAMRALEHWIVLQVVGSKNRVRNEGLYTVKALLNSRDYSQTLLQVCDRVHCNALTFLRKQGDTTAYGAASKDRLAQSINESDDTPEHKKAASDLVEMLDRFCRKEGKSFGWDPLETEAQNRRRLQLPVSVNASVQNAG
jgi:DNA repair exonuclease SbcCD ATPase subunit